jgi:hypothetical protein
MFCPKCGRRNEGDYKFCRGCGENMKSFANAMERRWLKLLYRALDGYIRHQNRRLPDNARSFPIFRWFWLMLIGVYLVEGLLFVGEDWWAKDWWVYALLMLLSLLTGFWDYVSFRRFSSSSSSDKKSSAQPASLPDSDSELPSAPTTNELKPRFGVTEATTRRLEPLTAEKRSGELL